MPDNHIEISDSPDPASGWRDASISLFAANLAGVGFAAALVGVMLVPFWLLWGKLPLAQGFWALARIRISLPALATAIVVHELLHGYGFLRFGKVPRDQVRFGVNWKALTPYAHCSGVLTAHAYKLSVALPGIVLGVIPAALAMATGNGWLVLAGYLMTAVAAGDAAILWALRSVPPDALVRDHPSRAGAHWRLPDAPQ